MSPYQSIDHIKSANKAAGRHFFEPDTMAFFQSRIESGVIDGRLFITSERAPTRTRMYTVREAGEGGEVDTAEGFFFQEFATQKLAEESAKDSLSRPHEARRSARRAREAADA